MYHEDIAVMTTKTTNFNKHYTPGFIRHLITRERKIQANKQLGEALQNAQQKRLLASKKKVGNPQ